MEELLASFETWQEHNPRCANVEEIGVKALHTDMVEGILEW